MTIIKVFKAILGTLSLISWFSSVALFEHYDATRPTKCDTSSGAIYAQNNHGHVVFLTAAEKHNGYALMVLAGVLFGITGILHLHIRAVERSRMRPRDFAGD